MQMPPKGQMINPSIRPGMPPQQMPMNPQMNPMMKPQMSMNQQLPMNPPPAGGNDKGPMAGRYNQPIASKNYVLGEIEGTTLKDRRYICRVQVNEKLFREFNKKIWE